ncbi:MAG: translation elongation factor Ts [candidate division WOR-3 bacterium]|nr:translation elongation factor Ts [candidate division WOR-3 bacterium]
MKIAKDAIIELKDRTGAGIMDCKNVLVVCNGDIDKAVELLRKKGIVMSEKKRERKTDEGIVEAYIHPGARLGVLVEVACESDFVARTPEFKTLVRDIAMQIAASNPTWIDKKDVPDEVTEKEKTIYEYQAKESGKPEKIIPKIVEGKIENFYKETCLLEQAFIKNLDISVEDLIKEHIAKFGENIRVTRFARFKVGG